MKKIQTEKSVDYSKKQKNTYSILGKIGDILMIPIIIISLLSSVFMFVQKANNKAPSIFGYSLVTILSESMTKSEFYKGQSVFVKKSQPDKLWEGDIIAFYFYKDPADKSLPSHMTILKSVDDSFKGDEYTFENRQSVDEIREESKVYFHEIIEVWEDSMGVRFFKTKGSSNAMADVYMIREDFVVGKYSYTPVWVRAIISFCGSSIGMIILVCAPLSILVFLQCLSLIEQVGDLVLEKKVISRQMDWRSDEVKKANIGIEMELYDKVYFYASSKKEEREEVKDFLWGYIFNNENLKKDELQEKAWVIESMEIYKKDESKYWQFWQEKFKGKKLEKLNNWNNIMKLQNLNKK